ncbi:MAG: four helix bundle protein [Bacteroidia bacterium]
MSQFSEALRKRTKEIAIKTIVLTRKLPRNDEGFTIRKQLIRSSSSVAANYRAACRGRSDNEFYSKLCITVEELDESILWLELSNDLELLNESDIYPVMKEAQDLLNILATSKSTLRRKLYTNDSD